MKRNFLLIIFWCCYSSLTAQEKGNRPNFIIMADDLGYSDTHSIAHTAFRYLWEWKGGEAEIMSLAIDETRYVQPTMKQLKAARGEEKC